jgi:deazaflavin-dependent oxidoreductase (nitroreductase family)
MPLRYVDPTRPTTAVSRAFTRFGRSPVGQFVARYVAAKTDPWLGRHTKGRVSWGMFNAPSATLKMTGAKTGQPREAQIVYFHDGRDVIAIASNYGGDRNPQWYHNLIAHPECELGGEAFRATEVTDPAEYARLYGLAEQAYAGYADYKEKTALVGRHIPILRLTPLSLGR